MPAAIEQPAEQEGGQSIIHLLRTPSGAAGHVQLKIGWPRSDEISLATVFLDSEYEWPARYTKGQAVTARRRYCHGKR
jgi:hypothetical protein